jgi:hypothetical protein
MKKLRTFIIVLVIILGAAWLYDYLFVAKPKEIVTTYFSLVNEWKFKEAMELEHEDNPGAYEADTGIFGKVTGINIDDAVNLLPEIKSDNAIQFKVSPIAERIGTAYIKNKKVGSIIALIFPLMANQAEVDMEYEVIDPNGKVRTKESTTIVLKKYGLSWKITDETNGNINKYLKELYTGDLE